MTIETRNEQTMSTTAEAMKSLAGKYLTFRLGAEEYAANVLDVREIMTMMTITGVPQVPPHVLGLINLRGKAIPVVDLRLKFGLSAAETTDQTCIVVVLVHHPKSMLMGIVVDSVCEVLNIALEELEATPDFGDHVTTDFIRGVAKLKGKVKILLDLDRVLGGDAETMPA